jgi:hypothetical protein
MALVDVLPMFVPKPLDLSGWKTRLAPKPDAIDPIAQTEPQQIPQDVQPTTDVTSPTVAPLIAPTTIPTSDMNLPDKYQAYEGLVASMDAAGITDSKARAALLGQFILEKGWGAKPAGFNYGNITSGSSWTGKTEDRGDKDSSGQRIKQNFRVYNSPDEFVNDYLGLLKRTYPDSYKELFSGNFDPERFSSGLVDGRYKYATDPTYKNKLLAMINKVLADMNRNK